MLKRAVQKAVGISDVVILDTQRIGADRFHGRTGLTVRVDCAVEPAARRLFAKAAHNALDCAAVIQHNHRALHVFFFRLTCRGVLVICLSVREQIARLWRQHIFNCRLHFGIDSGINCKAAVIQQGACLIAVCTDPLRHEVVQHFVDDRICKVAVRAHLCRILFIGFGHEA
ncbi:hypothetical protein SDC9_180817 [bioreactor metagenome]|uniref:Uncharacterized protein n=1 Tax=bioreactor metagenome TaxID=1076179 RepID=A0A645H4T0_9ZZZZ